ncbi:DUF6033 family protein [Butyrivibrio sp. AE2032]|uniref:DUF6033 family protein n=1 Tax=Butyrivibrio sp. AE2032 TaxID=1458463 RepID=UPI000553F7D3|nr:DUF6033 family protein [Butyrivibrio sp. AE2032]
MANGINGNINQLFHSKDTTPVRNGTISKNPRGPSKEKVQKKTEGIGNLFGESAKVELSPEVEMYGKVVDLLQKKYDNADVFVAGPNDDLSQIGGDLEYSIILSEDEMKLLASEDPADEEAKNKLLGQIDDAMKSISDMSEKIGGNTDESDEISNFGIQMDKNGNMKFFADINGNSFKADSMDDLIQNLISAKAEKAN